MIAELLAERTRRNNYSNWKLCPCIIFKKYIHMYFVLKKFVSIFPIATLFLYIILIT